MQHHIIIDCFILSVNGVMVTWSATRQPTNWV